MNQEDSDIVKCVIDAGGDPKDSFSIYLERPVYEWLVKYLETEGISFSDFVERKCDEFLKLFPPDYADIANSVRNGGSCVK